MGEPDAIPYPLTVLVGTLGRKKPDIGDGALDAPGDDDEDVWPQPRRRAASRSTTAGSTAAPKPKAPETKEGKALTDEQLTQIKTQISNLHSSCDFIMENFDLRAEARTNEQESLKTAKAVLAGANFAARSESVV